MCWSITGLLPERVGAQHHRSDLSAERHRASAMGPGNTRALRLGAQDGTAIGRSAPIAAQHWLERPGVRCDYSEPATASAYRRSHRLTARDGPTWGSYGVATRPFWPWPSSPRARLIWPPASQKTADSDSSLPWPPPWNELIRFCAAEPAQKASWADAGERRVGLQGLWKFQFAGGDDVTMVQAR